MSAIHSHPRARDRAPLVLIADDDPAVRTLFARALREEGFRTLLAGDGEEVLRLVRRRRVDVVLLDSVMPRRDGPAVLQELRAHEETRTLPAILVTGQGQEASRLSGLAAGADDYLAKPVSLAELIARVRAQLRGRQAWEARTSRVSATHRSLSIWLRHLPRDAAIERLGSQIVEGLATILGLRSIALLWREPDGHLRTLAARGSLAARFVADTPLGNSASGALLARAREGPWLQTTRGAARSAGLPADVAYVPLQGTGDGPDGLLAVADDATSRTTGVPPLAHRLEELAELADLMDAAVRPILDAAIERSDAAAVIRRVIETAAFTIVFQPIVSLAGGSAVAFEALSRFVDGTRPDERFHEAARVGLRDALEEATLRAAMTEADHLPPGAAIHLNVSPAFLAARGDLHSLVAGTDRSVVLELTEYEPVADYPVLAEAWEALGEHVELAVDDAGSGYASLRHILSLRPAVVKLDLQLVRGIDEDPARQALVSGLVFFVQQTGIRLVAEGVETEAERERLAALGVGYGQGYLFGRPAPAATFGVPAADAPGRIALVPVDQSRTPGGP